MAGRLLTTAVAAAAVLATASEARAEEEGWFWLEQRVPIVRDDSSALPRVDLRLFLDARFNRKLEGPRQGALRAGPLFYFHPSFFIATQMSTWATRVDDDRWTREVRGELEPTFSARLGPIALSDRNRFEVRLRPDSEAWFYRNMLRLTFVPEDSKWLPVIWDEALIELESPRLTENRLAFGLGYLWEPTTRVELGYLLRTRDLPSGVDHSHVLYALVFFDAPRPKPPPSSIGPEPPQPRPPGPSGASITPSGRSASRR